MNTHLIDAHREWRQQPMTQFLIQFIEQEMKAGTQAWLGGQLVHDPISGAQVLGKSQAMETLLEFIKEGHFIDEVTTNAEDTGL